LSQAAHIIVLGELLRKQFNFVPGIEKKIKVIPNGLPEGLRTDCCKKTLPEKGQKVRFLFLSNLLPSKGYLDLLEACAQLKRQGFRDFVCDFCGEFAQTIADRDACGSEGQRKEFFERISSGGLDNHAVCHGTVRGEQKEKLLRQAHVFIMPTYHPWEGQPISIIEALAFATPVISTRNNGIPEEVIDGYNGFFVEPQNPNDIARVIKQIIADQSKYAEMSRNAREHFDRNFTRLMHLRRLMAVICNISEEQIRI
jgi:glycosyltransferase involved in cell wall biosynthesis